MIPSIQSAVSALRRRSTSRHAMRRLAHLDDHLLRDMGLDREHLSLVGRGIDPRA